MLLDARSRETEAGGSAAERGASAGGEPDVPANTAAGAPSGHSAPPLLLRLVRVLPLGLIGFGLSGLLAKGLDLHLWPGTFLIALGVGLGLIALGYRLGRVRPLVRERRS